MGKVHFSPKRRSGRLSANVRSCLVQQHFASIWLTRTVVMRRYSVSRSGNYRRIGKRLSCVSKYNVSPPYVTLTFLTYKLLLFIPLKTPAPLPQGRCFQERNSFHHFRFRFISAAAVCLKVWTKSLNISSRSATL